MRSSLEERGSVMAQRILVVDDEEEILELLGKKLTTTGYSVIKSSNGKEALDVAKIHKPDLILLDIMMPYMDGPDMVAALKEEPSTENIPVIFLSGIVTKEDTQHPQGGVTVAGRKFRVLSKPFNFAELLVEVKKALAQSY